MRSEHDLTSVFKQLTHLIVEAVLNTDKSWDSNSVLSVSHREKFLVLETLCVKEAWITLDLRRAFLLHLGAILEHLSTHLCDGLAAIFLQLDEGSDNIVLDFADELLGRVAHRVDISAFSQQVYNDILFSWLLDTAVKVTDLWLTVVLYFLLKKEGVPHAHHDTTIILVHTIRQRSLVALGRARVHRILTMLVLVILVLVLVREAASPFGTVFLLLFLEDFDLDSWQSDLYFTGLPSDHFLAGDTLVDLGQELNILIHIDMSGPAVGNSEEHLLEHDQVHGGLAASVMNPLLCNLSAHLILSV